MLSRPSVNQPHIGPSSATVSACPGRASAFDNDGAAKDLELTFVQGVGRDVEAGNVAGAGIGRPALGAGRHQCSLRGLRNDFGL